MLNRENDGDNDEDHEDHDDASSGNKKEPINTQASNAKEIAHAIKQLKNGKAPEVDNIPLELRADLNIAVQLLCPLFQKI